MALSFDGGAVFGPDSTPETWTAIDEMVLLVGASLTPGDTVIHHLALYAPQEDSALPVLSAL